MKILFVTNRYPMPETPGDSPCIARQREALERMGHEVDLVFINSQRSRWSYLTAMISIFWNVQIRRRYDVVHAHYGQYCGLVACAHFSRPTVITFRGSDVLNPSEIRVSRMAARLANRLIVMSDEMKSCLGHDSAQVIPYGIDLELFQPASREEARKELELPAEVPLVLFPYDPARRVKRFDLVERTIDLLRDKFSGIQVVAIRNEPYERVPVYMNACDVMVLASDTEGAPLAIREAMACNLPVVSVDVGDVADVIGSTRQCHLVGRSPEEMAQGVAAVLQSDQRSNGRTIAETMSVDMYARSVVSLYQTCFPKCVAPVQSGSTCQPSNLNQ